MGTLNLGGASRDRTDDLYNAIVALSQLSYGPTAESAKIRSYPMLVKPRTRNFRPILRAMTQEGMIGASGPGRTGDG